MSKEINIQDYLHYYLGQQCQVKCNHPGNEILIGKITGVTRDSNHGNWVEIFFDTCHKVYRSNYNADGSNSNMHHFFMSEDEVNPILRPLSDMTEEETQELWIVIGGTSHLYSFGKDDLIKGLDDGDWEESGIQMDYYTMSCVINYLRKIGIDCDDLIDSGLAIDKTKM